MTTTYTLRATFQAKSGHKSSKTLATGLSLIEAIDKKTQLLERVPHCVAAEVRPEK